MAREYRSIASIQKTHGRKGEVVVVPTHGLPLLLHDGLEVVLVPPELKGPRSFCVRSCSDDSRGQLVLFDGVDSLSQASKMVGKTVLARVRDLPEDYSLHDVDMLMDREVTDVHMGSLGAIREVMRGPANDVWVVRGAYGEVLVPAVEPLVREWASEGPIVVELPSGLVGGDVQEGEVGDA